MIPLCRPLLPTADALLPYLREIDADMTDAEIEQVVDAL